jgi:hypothetical protein
MPDPAPVPMSTEESGYFAEGCDLFNNGRFWHAHEAWEEMWKSLKQRKAPEAEILLVQGLIQTAALLLHHQRRNTAGVTKQWQKLAPKLAGWTSMWGLDIETHLAMVNAYADDVGTWSLVAADHQLPQARD